MIWTRIAVVALTTLMFGSFATVAQDAPKATDEKKTEAKDEAETPGAAPNIAPEGTLKVTTVSDIKLTDKAREKELSIIAVFPEEAGKYPVILFSHGAGSSNDRSLTLPNYLASHGYVLLVPNHADARAGRGGRMNADQMFEQYDKDKDGKLSKEELPERMQGFFDMLDTDGDGFVSKDELNALSGGRGGRGGNPPEKPKEGDGDDEFDMLGNPRDSFLEDPAEPAPPQPGRGQGRTRGRRGPAPLDANSGIDRVADLKLILDNTAEIVKQAEGLKDKLDLEHVAVAGHNAGAYTAELIAGATVTVETEVDGEGAEKKEMHLRNVADKRVKAILALSPAGADQGGLSKESFKTIATPMMTVTGSEDSTGEGQDAAWKHQPFELSPEGGKYHVLIEGASNRSFTGGRAFGRRGAEETTDNIFEWVKTSALMFLNSTLKGDEAATKWLAGDTLKEVSEGKAAIERK
ncbi:MAG: hypothetical protein R3E76_09570 [Planctomycetota bacterium]